MTDAEKPGSQTEPHSQSGFTPPAKVLGREAKVLPKRFYKTAVAAPLSGGFTVHLDGRGVKTPGKRALLVPKQSLAEALAAEWAAQGDDIKPFTMPLTQLVCTAIDAVEAKHREVAEEIGRYAASDLLCYRADAPSGLVALQSQTWDPVLECAGRELGVEFQRATGIMPVSQPPRASAAVVDVLVPLSSLQLAAMHVLTSLMGSALLALAVLRNRLMLADAWRAAHLDEQWQIDRWGTDAEAEERQAQRLRTAEACALILKLTSDQ